MREPIAALLAIIGLLLALAPAPASAQVGSFEIKSDRKSTATKADLCITVDRKHAIVPDPGAMITPKGAPPFPLKGTFYPVIVARCDALNADLPSKWTMTDTRQLRVQVNGKPLCLSARVSTAFFPLVDPFLEAFDARNPTSPLHYLVGDLAPDGKLNETRLRQTPDLVASDCDRPDAMDFWVYDGANGTISGPGGNDGVVGSPRRCVTIHGDIAAKSYEPGMPVAIAACGDIRAYEHPTQNRQMSWMLSSGLDGVPTYVAPDPKAYFSGADGLPIVGPMGRCLTANLPSKNVVTSDCDGRVEQQWHRDAQAIRLGREGDCMQLSSSGAVELAACATSEGQSWRYQVRAPVPNPQWVNADVYAQIHPLARESDCLIVADDPFADPMRQRNPVQAAPCISVLPRQTSWFLTEKVLTIRLALLRASETDGSRASLGTMTDEAAKKRMESLAFYLSEFYSVLGIRFVFSPENDFLALKDSAANKASSPNNDAIARVAATTFFDRLTIATNSDLMAGGVSSGLLAEFEPDRMRNPMTLKPITSFVKHPDMAKDSASLPALSQSVGELSLNAGIDGIFHHAHEFGHFFGLLHTFQPDLFADTPDDYPLGDPWFALGSEGCGNARAATIKGVRIAPDRQNNEGYFGCLYGREHNSLTPMQLGYMHWQINNQLNRYPKVACQPTARYDANHVECENQASLDLCMQTAAYLQKRGGTDLVCQLGGRYRSTIDRMLRYPAVITLMRKTPAGKDLIKRLSGTQSSSEATFNSVAEKLRECVNLPLTMAVVHRLREFDDALRARDPVLEKAGFDEKAAALSAKEEKVILPLAPTVFTDGFIRNIPVIVMR